MSDILSITALLCIMNEVWVVVFSNTEADEEQAFGRQLHALGGGFYMCTVIVTNNGIVCVCVGVCCRLSNRSQQCEWDWYHPVDHTKQSIRAKTK